MPDTNQNGIPDKADKLIGLLLVVANIVLGAVAMKMDPAPVWVLIALTAVGSLAGLFTVGVIPRPRGGATLLVAGLALAAAGCTPKLVDGYRGWGLMKVAGQSANTVIVTTCKAKLVSCKSEHSKATTTAQQAYLACKAKLDDPKRLLECLKPLNDAKAAALEQYRKCKAGCTAAVKLWVEKLAPGYNAALALFWGALETARIAGDKNYTIPEKAMPGLCAAIKAPAFFEHLFGKTLIAIFGPILALKGLVCK